MHQVSAWRSTWGHGAGPGAQQRPACCPQRGHCFPGHPPRMGKENFLRDIKGPAQGKARPGRLHPSLQQFGLTQPLFPCQGSHQPGPLLRDAGCQEEEGLLHQETLAARLAL